MLATGPDLDDVANLAFAQWMPSRDPFRGAFGAAGQSGNIPDPNLMVHVSADVMRDSAHLSPVKRLLHTGSGAHAANMVKNESRTLAAFERVGLEIIAASLRITKHATDRDRLIVMPATDTRPPTVMLMTPNLKQQQDVRVISDDVDLPFHVLEKALHEVVVSKEKTPEAIALAHIKSGGSIALAETLLVSRPEIVLTRRPQMLPLCVPQPPFRIDCNGVMSTAGVLCRDADGDLGVTGAHHGVGPVGTEVMVQNTRSRVKRANIVQDIVFIPFRPEPGTWRKTVLGGVERDREPSPADQVRFDGLVNQRATRISGSDEGLLRQRATIQLKVQTPPDTDHGDSGCALVDTKTDRVLGFAFERTSYEDWPQLTDWIWAANALRSLDLVPDTGD